METETQSTMDTAGILVRILEQMRQRTHSYTRKCTYKAGYQITEELMKEYGKYFDIGVFTVRIEMFPRVNSLEDFWWVAGLGLYVKDEFLGEVIDTYINCENLMIELEGMMISVDLK